MKTYTLEECLNEDIGLKGTPQRDAFDAKVEEALQTYKIGIAIKQARLSTSKRRRMV